jgi:hypothetical protein
MRNLVCLFVLVVFGCNAPVTEEKSTTIPDSVNAAKSNLPVLGLDTISVQQGQAPKNQKDKEGRKQGVWDYYERGVLAGYETYEHGVLDGPRKAWVNSPAQMLIGQYVKGLKAGLWKHVDNDTNLVMVISYKSGEEIWWGFPYADHNYHSPIKGFNIKSDSVLVQCPYENDTTWYEGLFINKRPVGIHKMYHPNGKLKFEHNYITGKIKLYDTDGKFQREITEDVAYDFKRGVYGR